MPNPISLKDQCCHTFALSGDVTGKRDINKLFEDLTNRIGYRYNFGEGLNAQQLFRVRQETMQRIATLRDDTYLKVDDLYLCGGFREGQVSPEHMWIEDRTNNCTYDTMIHRSIVKVNAVGVDGEPFQTGCESSPFEGDEIFRVKVSDYTAGQVAALYPSLLKSKSSFFSGDKEHREKNSERHENTPNNTI